MAFASIAGGSIHYRLEGPDHAPVVVLSNSLGTDLSLWDRQMDRLSDSVRVLRYDTRGHGRSLVTDPPYSLERLGTDVTELLDHVGVDRAHFCGLSLGGMIGMWLGAHAPERVGRLVLANTAPELGPPEVWDRRIEVVGRRGMGAVADAAVERWFTPEFASRCPEAVEAARRTLVATPPEGYAGCCAAIRDMDLRSVLGTIRSVTLVVGGRDDAATTPTTCRALAEDIPEARYLELPAAHLSNVEADRAFTAAMLEFITPER